MIHLEYYLIVSAVMLFAGIYGFLTRRNTLAMLISVELILNATDINFAAFNRYLFLQIMELISICALFLVFIAPNVWLFGLAVVIIGLTSIGGQIIIPYIAYLTPSKNKGPSWVR